MKLTQGTILQNYTIIEPIGEGGMGEVYLAEETMLGRQVAIKRLNPLLTDDPQFSERFINEARIQAKLKHDNIVGLYNFFVEDEVYYMVMEYAEGNMLKELIAITGPIPEQRSLYIFRQIINALCYAHSKGVIHRDIKPSNIMIDANDKVKVMDFGIARLMSDKHLTRTGIKLGTLFYMSPEQVMAEKDIDHRTDIYSAGVVLYEMLTGRLPFSADTDSDYVVMKEIAESPLPDPRAVYPHISQSLVQLVESMTAKDKQVRLNIQEIISIIDHPDPFQGVPMQETVTQNPIEEPEVDWEQDIPDYPLAKPKEKKGPALLIVFSLMIVATMFIFISRGKLNRGGYPPVPEGFVYVPAGTFTMGDTRGEGWEHELPTHSVTLGSFYMGQHQVTQGEYTAIMGSNPASDYGVGNNYPVYDVSWYSAIKYCNLRSMAEGLTPVYSISGSTNPADWGAVPNEDYSPIWDAAICNFNANGYRLPTEAEWEYAARGATNDPDYLYSGSDNINDVAWHDGNSGSTTHIVGTKAPNALGLYDMSGNLLEWCWDWYSSSYYSSSPSDNPTGPASGSYRVGRGGYWYDSAGSCRVASRNYIIPNYGSFDNFGFRLCRAVL